MAGTGFSREGRKRPAPYISPAKDGKWIAGPGPLRSSGCLRPPPAGYGCLVWGGLLSGYLLPGHFGGGRDGVGARPPGGAAAVGRVRGDGGARVSARPPGGLGG